MRCASLLSLIILIACALPAIGQATKPAVPPPTSQPRRENVLSEEQWRRLKRSTDNALAWLADQQQADGSFRSDDRAQPAITSLAILAFLSCGHQPGSGAYGKALERAVAYVLSCRQEDGLLCRLKPEDHLVERSASHTGTYNHAISGLVLAEVYGTTDGKTEAQLRDTIQAAVQRTLELQQDPAKHNANDSGGWRYVRDYFPVNSDVSATSWHLMFLRSARNAGFDVPAQALDDGASFVEKCCQIDGRVYYGLAGSARHATITTVGAGALSLSLAGRHETRAAQRAGDWLLGQRLPQRFGIHRFHYHAFYYTQALYQLGGKYWSQAYPPMFETLTAHQGANGSWAPDAGEGEWGPCLSTSLAVLTLSVPFQLLPIYQR